MTLIKGVITVFLAIILLLLALAPVSVMVLLKLLAPGHKTRLAMTRLLSSFSEFWLACNRQCYCWIHRPAWLQDLAFPLSREHSYLVLANHRSWSDIPVLFFLMLGKVPLPRFLMKRVLVWLPVVGWGAWALDYPLLYRYSKEHLRRHPGDRLKDQQSLSQLCEALKQQPATIIIFAEGTRFSPAKHEAQNSNFQHLLNPKSGGLTVLLQGLGEQIHECLDFTLHYEDGKAGFWQFLAGELQLRVELKQYAIPEKMSQTGYANTEEVNRAVKEWLYAIWTEKDTSLSKEYSQ